MNKETGKIRVMALGDAVGKNEKVIKIIHRHWFDIFIQLAVVIFLFTLLATSIFVYPSMFPNYQDKDIYSIFLFLETTFALFLWIYTFIIWVDYYLDIWIITTERIINVEQKGLFVRNVSELRHVRVQDRIADL